MKPDNRLYARTLILGMNSINNLVCIALFRWLSISVSTLKITMLNIVFFIHFLFSFSRFLFIFVIFVWAYSVYPLVFVCNLLTHTCLPPRIITIFHKIQKQNNISTNERIVLYYSLLIPNEHLAKKNVQL